MTQFVATTYGGAIAITPADGGTQPFHNALQVAATGNAVVQSMNGVAITYTGLPAGAIIPFQCAQVQATGTTATLVGLV